MKDQKRSKDWYLVVMMVAGVVNFLIGMYTVYFVGDEWGLGSLIIGSTVILMALIMAFNEDLSDMIKHVALRQSHASFNVSARKSPNATDTLPYQGRWKDEPVNKL